MKNTLFALTACLVLSGCATIVEGTRQTIQFDSRPHDAHCDIIKDNNIYFKMPEEMEKYVSAFRGKTDAKAEAAWKAGFVLSVVPEDHDVLYEDILTPASIELEKSKFLLVVSCFKEGYKSKIISIVPRSNLWLAGNIILGGPLGIIIDTASGADAYYPSQIVVELDSK